MKTKPDRKYPALRMGLGKREKQRVSRVVLKLGLLIFLFGSIFLTGCGKERGEESEGLRGMVDTAASGGANTIGLNPAEVLPDGPSTIFGVVDHYEDKSIFVTQLPSLDTIIATGNVEKGPIVEILVVNDTIIYRDVTSGEVVNGVVQEEVAPGSVDDIEKGSLINVWGEQRGDRIVAEVVKYNNHSQLILPSGPVN